MGFQREPLAFLAGYHRLLLAEKSASVTLCKPLWSAKWKTSAFQVNEHQSSYFCHFRVKRAELKLLKTHFTVPPQQFLLKSQGFRVIVCSSCHVLSVFPHGNRYFTESSRNDCSSVRLPHSTHSAHSLGAGLHYLVQYTWAVVIPALKSVLYDDWGN